MLYGYFVLAPKTNREIQLVIDFDLFLSNNLDNRILNLLSHAYLLFKQNNTNGHGQNKECPPANITSKFLFLVCSLILLIEYTLCPPNTERSASMVAISTNSL